MIIRNNIDISSWYFNDNDITKVCRNGKTIFQKVNKVIPKDDWRLKRYHTRTGEYTVMGCYSVADIHDTLIETSMDEVTGTTNPCTAVTLSNCVAQIAFSAFTGWNKLETIEWTDNVFNIDSSVFSGCTRLSGVTFNEGLITIGGHAFDSCKGLKEITFPSTLKYINEAAFSNCTGLEKIDISKTQMVTAYRHMFSGCTNIMGDLELPSTMTTINDYAFNGAFSNYLASDKRGVLTMNENLRKIGAYGLGGYFNYAICKGVNPPDIEQLSFYGGNAYNFYVPDEAVDAYKTKWGSKNNSLPNRIKPISELNG